MVTNPRVKADSLYNVLSLKPFHLGISVEFIEIADPQGKVGIGKKLYRLGLGKTHIEGINVLLDRPFLKQCGKCPGSLLQLAPVCGNLI